MSWKSRTSDTKVLRPWILDGYYQSGSDQCNWFCFPVRRDLLNGSSRFESNKNSVRNFKNYFNHNFWFCSSNTNFSFSILIGWLGPCVGGLFLFRYFLDREMTGFHFENGRRCIRQILEDYQAGTGLFFVFTQLAEPVATRIPVFLEISDWRRKRGLYSEIEGRDSRDFRLSVNANWVSLRFEKRKGN